MLGPNGAGKTTTLECLEGLRQPDGGALRILGVDPAREPRRLRNLIGVQLQTSGLPGSMTRGDALLLRLPRRAAALRPARAPGPAASEGTPSSASCRPGQQRRLALALAMAPTARRMLFLDEPTAGLDVASRAELHALMQRAAGRRDARSCWPPTTWPRPRRWPTGSPILLPGKIVATARPRADRHRPRRDEGVGGQPEGSLPGADGTSPSRPSSQRAPAGWLRHLLSTDPGADRGGDPRGHLGRRGDRLVDLRVERPSLEERFLEITHEPHEGGRAMTAFATTSRTSSAPACATRRSC